MILAVMLACSLSCLVPGLLPGVVRGAVPGAAWGAVQVPAMDPATLARELRDLRRDEHQTEALALIAGQPLDVLADPRVVGERIQILLDEDRIEEARTVDAALGPVRTGPQPLLVARLLLELRDGHAQDVLDHVEAVLPGLKNPWEVQAVRVRALCALERWEEAARAFTALPADFPAQLGVRVHVDVLLAHGQALSEDDDLLERAIPLLEEALALQPSRIDVRTELVIALSQWHRADRAEQLVQEVLDGADGNHRAALLYAQGRVHRGEQRDEQAVVCFRQVLALCPGHARATLALARSLVRTDHEEEALVLVNARLQRAPEDVDALFLLAECALDHREPQQALDALQRVLDHHPQSLKALYLSSRALALLGDDARQSDVLRRYQDRTAALAMQ